MRVVTAFPVINTAFPPGRVAVLYVVGDRVLPDFADGDVSRPSAGPVPEGSGLCQAIITSQHITPVTAGEIVLHKNHSAGGFHVTAPALGLIAELLVVV